TASVRSHGRGHVDWSRRILVPSAVSGNAPERCPGVAASRRGDDVPAKWTVDPSSRDIEFTDGSGLSPRTFLFPLKQPGDVVIRTAVDPHGTRAAWTIQNRKYVYFVDLKT